MSPLTIVRFFHPSMCLFTALTTLGCGRIEFDPMDGSVPMDAARDMTLEIGTEDADAIVGDSAPDAADAGSRVDITCGTIAPTSPSVPTAELVETGMRSDGLTILSRRGNTAFAAVRTAADAPFSDWVVSTSIASIGEDPTFIDFEGAEIGAGAGGGGGTGRHLRICRPPFDAGGCDRIEVFDEARALIVDDHDGPSLAVRGGELLMAFNRSTAIYVARPRAADLLAWDAALVDMGPLDFDDPALTNDGAILLASGPGGALYIAVWDAAAGTYVDPHIVPGTDGGSIEIGLESVSGFELFVSGTTRGTNEPHWTTCTF